MFLTLTLELSPIALIYGNTILLNPSPSYLCRQFPDLLFFLLDHPYYFLTGTVWTATLSMVLRKKNDSLFPVEQKKLWVFLVVSLRKFQVLLFQVTEIKRIIIFNNADKGHYKLHFILLYFRKFIPRKIRSVL